LSRNFKSSAAWVFVLQGNVRDYLFDAHQGYGPLADILGAYWRNTTLFESGAARGEAVMVQYSLSGGIEIGGEQNGSGASALRTEVERHRNETARASTDERVFRDLSFLRAL